jgi:hypothetical protein
LLQALKLAINKEDFNIQEVDVDQERIAGDFGRADWLEEEGC